MFYTVNKLSQLAGVSVRTLHYYDEIGLLKPSKIKSNGYREYEEKELLTLQQIMFFKELDFSLKDIKFFISSKCDIETILIDQKELLKLKRKRIDNLINTINKTIGKINKENNMSDKELYNSFTDEEIKKYTEEARERWGNTKAFKESQERVGRMTKEDMKKIQEESDILIRKIASKINLDFDDEEVQELINQHYNNLRHFYEPDIEIYNRLADMYIADERFKKYFEKYKIGLTQFMHDAMKFYCKNIKSRN